MAPPKEPNDIGWLLVRAKRVKMTPEDVEEQRRSFAYGNTKIENERITRETVDREADRMKRGDGDS